MRCNAQQLFVYDLPPTLTGAYAVDFLDCDQGCEGEVGYEDVLREKAQYYLYGLIDLHNNDNPIARASKVFLYPQSVFNCILEYLNGVKPF